MKERDVCASEFKVEHADVITSSDQVTIYGPIVHISCNTAFMIV